MVIVKALLAGLLFILLGLTAAAILLVGTVTGLLANSGVTGVGFSEEALQDIPQPFIDAYRAAGSICPGLPAPVLAGIGKVESDHGRHGGSTVGPDGIIRPPIIGIPLDGRPGVALIRDTDNGRLDGDLVYDRAVGPFQFIPSTWELYERSVGGQRNPNYVPDAVQAVVWHLCPNGTLTDLEAAIFNYNRSQGYVDDVLAWAQRYTGQVTGTPIAGYALPNPGITAPLATRPHHDYPAWDFGTPLGTPTFAMVNGTVAVADGTQPIYQPGLSRCGNLVVIEGVDQVRYTYCHLSQVAVTTGDSVEAGQLIGATGGQPGAAGAGNTTGPHLHLGMRGQGRSLCPQRLLTSILDGAPINPLTLPSAGCIS